MRNQSIFALTLLIGLYGIWVWSLSAQPPFPDFADWPKTDFSRHAFPLSEIIEGGPGKDGIQSIDVPAFNSIKEAENWLPAREPVVAFISGTEARAYPLQILIYHEIVNDLVDGQSIAVTYCPLCNAAMVFDRLHRSELLEFGTTGKVHTSNLVMYDRSSESWWLQFTGEGVVGKYTGEKLTLLPSQIVSFEQFKNAYPGGVVLSKQTGFDKKYGVNPYAGYDSRSMPYGWFFRKTVDTRLAAMERVLGVVTENETRAYPFSTLNVVPILQQQVDDHPVLIVSKKGIASAVDKKLIRESKDTLTAAAYSRVVNGKVLDFKLIDAELIDIQTNSRWSLFGEAVDGPLRGKRLVKLDRGVYFAFVWLEFYPQSEIYLQ